MAPSVVAAPKTFFLSALSVPPTTGVGDGLCDGDGVGETEGEGDGDGDEYGLSEGVGDGDACCAITA